jgi:hypothetical protein
VTAIYLYALIKGLINDYHLFSFDIFCLIVPWELYMTARSRRQGANRVAMAYTASDRMNAEAERRRSKSARELWMLERFYFLMVFASPLMGAMFLKYVKMHVHVYQNVLNQFPMALYLLTAYLRPLNHLSQLLQSYAAELQEEVHYPHTAVEDLQRLVRTLDGRMGDMSTEMDRLRTEQRLHVRQTMETSVEPHLKAVNKDLKRTAKKEKQFQAYSNDRFRDLEQRLMDQEVCLQEYRDALEVARADHRDQRSRLLLAPAYYILDSFPTAQELVSMPARLAIGLTTWWIPRSVKSLIFHSQQPTTSAAPRPSITASGEGIYGDSRLTVEHAAQNLASSSMLGPHRYSMSSMRMETPSRVPHGPPSTPTQQYGGRKSVHRKLSRMPSSENESVF